MSTHRYLIWDFDGTLGYRTGMWSGALLDVLKANALGDHITTENLRPFVLAGFRWHNAHVKNLPNLPAEQWWQELEPIFQRAFQDGAGLSEAEARRLAPEVRGAYIRLSQWNLFPDVQPILTELTGKGWRHILLSNHVPELGNILRSLAIHHHFAQVYNSAETGLEKPHPEAFAIVRASLPDSSHIWMIGDNPIADVEGAEAAGIPAILVRRTHPSAKRYAENLADVIRILESQVFLPP